MVNIDLLKTYSNMQNQAIIREYTNHDREKVLHLLRVNTPTYFSPDEEKDLLYYLSHEIEEYFVIELDHEIVGCGGINFSVNHTAGKISWDFLHPNFHGQGLGTLLLNYRIERLKKIHGVKKITVRTSQLAYKFYEKSGFKLFEQAKDYWAPGFDLYNMEYTNM